MCTFANWHTREAGFCALGQNVHIRQLAHTGSRVLCSRPECARSPTGKHGKQGSLCSRLCALKIDSS